MITFYIKNTTSSGGNKCIAFTAYPNLIVDSRDVTKEFLHWIQQRFISNQTKNEKLLDVICAKSNLLDFLPDIKAWLPKEIQYLTINLDQLKLLDEWFQQCDEPAVLLSEIMKEVYAVIKADFGVGLTGQMIYYHEAGQPLPAEYRHDIDSLIDSREVYESLTTNFSYQFSKALSFLPALTTQHTRNPYKELNDSLDKHVKFMSINEGLFYLYQHRYRDSLTLTLSFGPTVSYTALRCLIEEVTKKDYEFRLFELNVIFYDPAYQNDTLRQQVFEDTLAWIKQHKCQKLFHVFLLTKSCKDGSLVSLSSPLNTEKDAFTELQYGAGYYLSHDSIIQWTSLHIQEANQTKAIDTLPTKFSNRSQSRAYIISYDAPTSAYRASKRYDAQALRSQITFNTTHHYAYDANRNEQRNHAQEMTQQQALNQNMTLGHQHQSSVQQSMNSLDIFRPCHDMLQFSDELLKHASRITNGSFHENRTLCANHYLTDYYSKHNFWTQLTQNSEFRNKIVRTLYGNAYCSPMPLRLSRHSFVQMDSALVKTLLEHIKFLADGLEPRERVIDNGFSLYALSLVYQLDTLVGFNFQNDEYKELWYLSPCLSVLESMAHYQSQVNSYALIRDEDLHTLSAPEQKVCLAQMADLLTLLSVSHDIFSEEKLKQLLDYLINLITFYCPTHDLQTFHALLSLFNTLTPDYLRIILQVALVGYRTKIKQFLELLDFLEERSLLTHFHDIYFQYAQTTLSVVHLLQPPFDSANQVVLSDDNFTTVDIARPVTSSLFLRLAQQTPVVNSQNDWPSFEKFAYHFLLFSAVNLINIQQIDFNYISKFWSRVYGKILIYTNGSSTVTDAYLERMVQNIINDAGFAIEPFHTAKTLFIGLEQLIDHAIRHDTLAEQLSELRGLSLLWTDALYAINNCHYKVVSKEMLLKLETLSLSEDPGKSTFLTSSDYNLSLHHLKNAVMHQPLSREYDSYIAIVFRYLGGESLRDKLSFYRNFFLQRKNPYHPVYHYFQVLLLGYVVLTKTGENYTQEIDQVALSESFLGFLKQKDYCTDYNGHTRLDEFAVATNQVFIDKIDNEYRDIIIACVADFHAYIQHIKVEESHGTVNLWTFYQQALKQDVQNSLISWAWSWNSLSYSEIPAVFKKTFDIQNLAQFLILNKAALLSASFVFDKQKDIVWWILEAKITATMNKFGSNSPENKHYLMTLLHAFYPNLTITVLIKDLSKLESFIEEFGVLSKADDYPSLSSVLKGLIAQKCYSIETGLMLIELINQHRSVDSYNGEVMIGLLMGLLSQKSLLMQPAKAQTLIKLLSSFYFEHVKPKWLKSLLYICERLLVLENDVAIQTLQTILNLASAQESDKLLDLCGKLSGSQLHGLAEFLETGKVSIDFLCLIWIENKQCDFKEFQDYFQIFDKEHSQTLILLVATLHKSNPRLLIEYLNLLKNISFLVLSRLSHFVESEMLAIDELVVMLEQPNVSQAIIAFERGLYFEHLDRFQYNTVQVIDKIAQITLKSSTEYPDSPLSLIEQTQLLNDFQCMMSYMMTHPVLIEKNQYGQQQMFTIHELTDAQFPLVFQQLSLQIQAQVAYPKKSHAYRLMLVALACEALYRSIQKFPQDTQILCVLHGLRHSNLIQEVKTGGGKSIISALYIPLLYAERLSVDIVTENDELADTGLRKFKRYYQLLGMRYARQVIKANSSYYDYADGGINHSTPSNLVFFRAQMALQKKSLPSRAALLCDEIDAVLTTTIQYRLAATLDPIYLDLKSWTIIYSYLLSFVKDDELFINNTCDKDDDVENFKHYVLCQHLDNHLTQFLQKVPHQLLDQLLESAPVPATLTSGEDYLPIQKKGQKNQYAAPIIMAGTKRPAPNVSYGNGLQPLLHMHANTQLSKGELLYGLEVDTETLMVTSAKNFFDFYRLQGGQTIGLTGTPGSKTELQEFAEYHDLIAYHYPAFHPDLSEDMGVIIVDGAGAQHEAVLGRIRHERITKPAQPILAITDLPKSTTQIYSYLSTNTADLKLQSYNGYESIGVSEKEILIRAGHNDMVTVATQSLSRGADFETKHLHGLFEICCASDLTENEWLQIIGRVARNGKPGQFCAIINSHDLLPETAHIQDPSQRFYVHRQMIGLRRQQERLKTRLLQDVRYFIVNDFFLKMKAYAENLWAIQYGFHSHLISEQDFLTSLRDFNKNTEQHYMRLLEDNSNLSDIASDAFIEGTTQALDHILDVWFPDHFLQNFQAIAPLIPLEPLQSLPLIEDLHLKDLAIFSEFLAMGWRYAGHQPMQNFWLFVDDVVVSYQPYFNKECHFITATLDILEKRQLLHVLTLVTGLNELKESIVTINVDEALNAIAMPSELCHIAPVETLVLIQQFLVSYIEEVTHKIQEKRWSELCLPDLHLQWIQDWLNRIQTAFTIFNYMNYAASFAAGPVPFVINRFVLPMIMPWIKTLLKKIFVSSESTMLQVLTGIDDVFEEISQLFVLLNKQEGHDLTVNDLLDKMTSLFQNKAIILLITQFSEQKNIPNINLWLSLIPEISMVLASYRDVKLKDINQSDLPVTLLLKIGQSDWAKNIFDVNTLQPIVDKIQSLSPSFSGKLNTLSVIELVSLIKVLAHPTFCDFINTLPPDAQFQDLIHWLDTPTEQLPLHLHQSFQELRLYQTDNERIAQETRHAFIMLKSKFKITALDIQTYLNHLKPTRPMTNVTPVLEPLAFSYMSYVMDLKWARIGISYAITVLLNYFFFQWSLLLLTMVFTATICLPVIYQYMVSPAKESDEFIDHIAPPLSIDIIDEHALPPPDISRPSICNFLYQRLVFWPDFNGVIMETGTSDRVNAPLI